MQVRPPACAGTFYPAAAQAVAGTVRSLLDGAAAVSQAAPPKALIVPHAGYRYSGATAAAGYATLASGRDTIRRVVLLGPTHRVPVRGLALPGASALATPLGEVAVDAEAVASLAALPQVVQSQAAHAFEHSLEVQLPFLQTVLGDFRVVPLAVGDATPEAVREVLDALWGGPETLLVVSSDLSHFLPYANAQAADQATVERILHLTGPLSYAQACGGTPVSGLLLAARQRQLQPRLLALCNSGDCGGDRARVVGYAALAFSEPPHVNP